MGRKKKEDDQPVEEMTEQVQEGGGGRSEEALDADSDEKSDPEASPTEAVLTEGGGRALEPVEDVAVAPGEQNLEDDDHPLIRESRGDGKGRGRNRNRQRLTLTQVEELEKAVATAISRNESLLHKVEDVIGRYDEDSDGFVPTTLGVMREELSHVRISLQAAQAKMTDVGDQYRSFFA